MQKIKKLVLGGSTVGRVFPNSRTRQYKLAPKRGFGDRHWSPGVLRLLTQSVAEFGLVVALKIELWVGRFPGSLVRIIIGSQHSGAFVIEALSQDAYGGSG